VITDCGISVAVMHLSDGPDLGDHLEAVAAAGVRLIGGTVAVRPEGASQVELLVAGVGARVVEVDAILPWAAAVNASLSQAEGEIALITDTGDDFDPNWLNSAVKILNGDFGLIIGSPYAASGLLERCLAGNVLIQRTSVERAGGFDDLFRTRTYAIADLARRFRRLGIGVRWIPTRTSPGSEAWDAVVDIDSSHFEGQSEKDDEPLSSIKVLSLPIVVIVAEEPTLLAGPIARSIQDHLSRAGCSVVRALTGRKVSCRSERSLPDLQLICSAGEFFADVIIALDPAALLSSRRHLGPSNPAAPHILALAGGCDRTPVLQRAARVADLIVVAGGDLDALPALPLRSSIVDLPSNERLSCGDEVADDSSIWRKVIDRAIDHRRRVLGDGAP
jgi:hypothetical protein